MKPGKYIYLAIDYKMSGVGSNSCGPKLAEKYSLTEKEIRFDFLLTCKRAKNKIEDVEKI